LKLFSVLRHNCVQFVTANRHRTGRHVATDSIILTAGAACNRDIIEPSIGDKDIAVELEQVIASATFRSAPRLAAFLRFVVEMTLAGRGDRIKGYTIGAQALGRGESFDPQTDPIVRVEAARLRRALARYYGGTGSNDPVVIELPRGGYVPTFRARTAREALATPDADSATKRGSTAGAALEAVLAGLIALRQRQVEAMAADVESARQMLDVMRDLLVAVGGDAGRMASPARDATSAGGPARGRRRSETPPRSQYRRCPDRPP
jgi:hypothetical protein